MSEYFTTLHKELLSYLEEMHVGTFLANMMFAVPPEQMKFLTAEQIAEAFPQKDPAWDEVTVARRASLYGMNSLTYRAQWVQQLSECSSRALIQATSLDHADCLPSQAAAKSPIFIDEFAAPPLLFSGQCSQMPDLSVHRSGNGDFLTCVSAMTLRRVAFSPLFEAKIAD
ncbi:MAG: hypothetical protein JF627_07510 [Alphaproteobacteria bacterium]|nr:hypothetical protein [Alphaproteobacteria bacterium]